MAYLDNGKIEREEYFIQVEKIAYEIIGEDNFLASFRLYKEINSCLNEEKIKAPELYKKYYNLSLLLKWEALNIIKEKEVIDLFKNNFLLIFSIPDYNIWEKLKIVLISIIVLGDRDLFKKELVSALEKNEEKIGREKIKLGNEFLPQAIKNWIKDYIVYAGGKEIDKLKITEYFINNQNIKKLSKEDKEKIKTIINLYQRLKLSSKTIEGVEEDIPIDREFGRGVITDGVPYFYKKNEDEKRMERVAQRVIERRDKNKDKRKELDLILNNYRPDSLERRAIEEEIEKLKKT